MEDEILVHIKPAKLSKPALIAIAQIVRASADLEDVIDLWIFKLADISQSKATLMLGRSNISTKLNIAEALSKICDEVELHNLVFDDNMNRLLRCRNAIAHGQLLGKAPSGWVFSTSAIVGYEGTSVARRAESYSTKTLARIAKVADGRIALMDDILGLKPLRDKRQWQHLQEYQSDQKSRTKGAKQKRQRNAFPK